MPVKLKCMTCEKDFFVDPYRIKENAKYCSRECFNVKWESKHVFNCINCGKEKTAFGYTKGRKKYCSKKCMLEFRHTPLELLVKQNYEVKENGCWEWTNSISSQTGYGKLDYKGKTLAAHRASYTIHKGEIPKGKHICHTCDNRKCVNPEHLWVGTQQDNMQDMVTKGRKYISTGKNIKHSVETVKEVKRLKNEGKTYVEIFNITNVPIGTACAIVNGERRKDVSP